MKRDVDLYRKILEFTEINLNPDDSYIEVELDGYDSNTISRHVELLEDCGMLEAWDNSTCDGCRIHPQRITHEGFEFLDAVRSDDQWDNVKDIAKNSVGTVSLEALKAAIAGIIQGMF